MTFEKMNGLTPLRALVLENIDKTAVDFLRSNGFEVEHFKEALSEADLWSRIAGVHLLCIRSKTKVTLKVLEAADKLFAIGCFCIGTDQVDLEYARKMAIPVFNSPFSNCRSVAEMVLCEMIMLARQLGDRNIELHSNIWNKSAKGCYEIRGKTLGIIGYGHIGSQLSIMAEALGMQVIFYDKMNIMPHGLAQSFDTMDAVLRSADFVTLHVPDAPETVGMIGIRELCLMKEGAYFINASRGKVVLLDALHEALLSGHLGGAALDVYPMEPEFNGGLNSELRSCYAKLSQCNNVILTPHIGGSTEEAQRAIGQEVSQALFRYISTGSTIGSVDFPEVELKSSIPLRATQCRLMNVHHNVPGVLKKINKILSSYNISKQTSDSISDVAYLIADLDDMANVDHCRDLLAKISRVDDSISSRMVHGTAGHLLEDGWA